ncbi:hypothetical protein FKK32_28935, partial [Klebsiella pneumoniae]|nr:hypothetical protein [Klebsiella pneumoniae]
MTDAQHIDGFILTPAGFIRGVLEHQEGRIHRIDGVPVSEEEVRHGAQWLPLILPGFVDLHVHGGGGNGRATAPTVTLTVAAFPAIDEIVRSALPAWRALHPEVEVKVVSREVNDHHTAMTTELSTAKGLPDVM